MKDDHTIHPVLGILFCVIVWMTVFLMSQYVSRIEARIKALEERIR